MHLDYIFSYVMNSLLGQGSKDQLAKAIEQIKREYLPQIQATLLIPDMCNPDLRLNRTDSKVPVPSYMFTCKLQCLIRTIYSGLWLNWSIFCIHILPFNPLMLTAAISSLTILMIICRRKQSQENT